MLNIAKVQKIFKRENFTSLFSVLWPAISFMLGLHSTAKNIIFGAGKPPIGPPLFPFHTLMCLQNGSGGAVGTHGSCVRATRNNHLVPRLLVNCQLKRERTHRPCVPTCIRVTRHVSHIDNQRLTYRIPMSAILACNMAHITAQSQPFHRTKWLRWETD